MSRDDTDEVTRIRWCKALELFDHLLDLDPTEREERLASTTREEPELGHILRELLSSHDDPSSKQFMEGPVAVYQSIDTNPQTLIGSRIGAYRITRYLSRGGMGLIYLAERDDRFFSRRVAVKLISADLDPGQFNRFRREVQVLADLNHPNLVTLYDAGRMGDGRPYLVMEYIEGRNLREWLNSGRLISPVEAAEIIGQAGAGLKAAHQLGIIHRDIKPANIVLTEIDGKLKVKVLDFGIAARRLPDGISVSSTQGAIGTLLYMSPEQVQRTKGEDLTPASDIYSLALTAYELLTGRPANDGRSEAEVIANLLYQVPVPPSRLVTNRAIPAAVDDILMKALAKDPADRYQDMIEFTDDLKRAITVDISEGTEEIVAPALPKQDNPVNLIEQQGSAPVTPLRSVGRSGFILAAVLTIAVTAAVAAWRFLPDSEQVTGLPATGNPGIASTMEKSPSAGLEIELAISSWEYSFKDCRFTLFKSGIDKVPRAFNADNSLVIIDKITRRYPQKSVDREIILKRKVAPGEYLVHFSCPGFKTVNGKQAVRENPETPGRAKISATLEPE